MYFLSGSVAARDAVVEEFLSCGEAKDKKGFSGTLVLFRSERDVPDSDEGIRLHAPGKSGSEPFDPALEFFAALPSVSEAALAFAGSLVTDGDMMASRDPIWSYNARMLTANLFSAGVRYWGFLHETAEDYELPSLTDTIFGMLDSLANARTDGAKKLPPWWRFASDSEREFFKATVLSAPASTAGSLLAVTNSYTSNIMRNYSQSKCRPLFDDNMLDLHVHIASITPSLLSVLLESAHAAWGGDLRIAAAGLHSWGKRYASVLANFMEASALPEENILLCAAAPSDILMSVWNGSVAWGADPTQRASLLFRDKAEETTGNKDGFVVSLEVETPANCGSSEYILLSEDGWSVGRIDAEAFDRVFGAERFRLFNDPEMGADDLETMRLKRMVGLGDRVSGMFEKEGVCYIRGDDDCEFVFGDFVSSDESPSPEAPEPEATRDERSASTEIEESDYDEWSMFGPPPDDDQEDADT